MRKLWVNPPFFEGDFVIDATMKERKPPRGEIAFERSVYNGIRGTHSYSVGKRRFSSRKMVPAENQICELVQGG